MLMFDVLHHNMMMFAIFRSADERKNLIKPRIIYEQQQLLIV